MDVKQLEYFVKVCDCGSFNQAASRNYISPQGINASILRLEKELGRQLLIRHNNGVEPTADGKFLYQRACQIMSILHECDIHFQTELIKSSTLSMAITTDILSVLPAAACDLIINKYDMELRPGGGYTCETDLLSGLCSFALVDGPPFNPKLTYQHCFKMERFFVANKLHKLANQKNLTMKDLKDCRFVTANATFKVYGDFLNLCLSHNFTPEIPVYANSLSEMRSLLNQNTDLIGISYDYYVSRSIDSNIVVLPINDLFWTYNIYLAYCKSAHFSAQEKNFFSDFLSSFTHKVII